MKQYEKRFWEILTNLFVGAEVKGKSGYINLMRSKQKYFQNVKSNLLFEINSIVGDNEDFRDELYDKLYSFFHRYFSDSGSIYYNYTPLFYNIYTKAYNDSLKPVTTYVNDYEQIISNKEDTTLFYKTQMLYYVKSEKVFKDLEVTIEDKKFIFDVSSMQAKFANEKRDLVYTLEKIEKDRFYFSVMYSERSRKTKIDAMLKEAKKLKIGVNEDDFKKAFKVFEKQANIDYFINKDAKKFLTEQLEMWLYQYMFAQESDFDIERFVQIKGIKKVALKLIDFIAQFENELVKIWNKPRFVIDSNVVVTLDKLQEKDFDIEKLTSHRGYEAQQQEWRDLGIDEGDGLVQNPHLPFDTKYFSDLKEEIEELFDEEEFDGLLIKSENYQALNTILHRYKGLVDLIYIDPPFNTGSDFAYIDRFQDSSWLTLMDNRLELTKDILSKQGSFYLHLDHNANYLGRMLCNKYFDIFRREIVWNKGNSSGGKAGAKNWIHDHDTILNYSFNDKENILFNKQYIPYSDKYIEERFVKDENGELYRLQGDGRKQYLKDSKGVPSTSVWNDISDVNVMAKERYFFTTQKPENLLNRIVKSSSDIGSYVLDYFSGSGVSISVAHKLQRKWIGIEMGEHFNTFYDAVEEVSKNRINSETRMRILNIIEEKKDRYIVSVKKTGILGRMKEVLANNGFHEPSKFSLETQYKGGGLFKYYALEQYEQILRTLNYTDAPQEWLQELKSDAEDCFLFDEKLSNAVDTSGEKYKIDISKIYDKVDLKETIHNLTAKRPVKITDDSVYFKNDDKAYPLMQILKPLLVW